MNLLSTITQASYRKVANKKELMDSVAAGYAVIVVCGTIDMDDTEIILHNSQKLVGESYLFPHSPLSKITFNKQTASQGIAVANNCKISDLSIDMAIKGKSGIQGIIFNDGYNATLCNLNLNLTVSDGNRLRVGAIVNVGFSQTRMDGTINIKANGRKQNICGIFSIGDYAKIIQGRNSSINIDIAGDCNVGIYGGIIRISSTSNLMIEAENKNNYFAINAIMKYCRGSRLGLKNTRTGTNEFWIAKGFRGEQSLGRQHLSGLNLKVSGGWKNSEAFSKASQKLSSSISSFHTKRIPELIDDDMTDGIVSADNTILTKFNEIIKQAEYNGVNLLLGDDFEISDGFKIKGVNADARSLGLTPTNWQNVTDIKKSINELNDAVLKLQKLSLDFSCYYSVLSQRMDSIIKKSQV